MIWAVMATAWALKAMPGTSPATARPSRLTDRHDADGRGPSARRDDKLLETTSAMTLPIAARNLEAHGVGATASPS